MSCFTYIAIVFVFIMYFYRSAVNKSRSKRHQFFRRLLDNSPTNHARGQKVADWSTRRLHFLITKRLHCIFVLALYNPKALSLSTIESV